MFFQCITKLQVEILYVSTTIKSDFCRFYALRHLVTETRTGREACCILLDMISKIIDYKDRRGGREGAEGAGYGKGNGRPSFLNFKSAVVYDQL